MADVWLPGAYRDPGRNSGYNAGRSSMVRAVAHYTVGSDSRSVGRDGYFHWLIHRDASRENGCTQYAETDAVTWHGADEGNPYGPGIEYERNVIGGVGPDGLSEAEPLTENQIAWGDRIVEHLAAWGITAALYDGARYEEEGWRGWVNHQAIDSSRSDGLTRDEWERVVSGGGPPPDPIDWTRVIGEREEEDDVKFRDVRLDDGRTVTAIRGSDGGVYYRVLDVRGDYEGGPVWDQIPGVCRFTPDLVATPDGGARLKVVGGDWGAYEAKLDPGARHFSGLAGMGPGTVAGLGNYE